MKFTEAGEPYYVDHVSKKTQWQHPAITGPQVSEMVTLKKQILKLLIPKSDVFYLLGNLKEL